MPQPRCWCAKITPMRTRTKFVFLMHPYENRQVKLNTGRLTHLCLENSELHVAESFDAHRAVQTLLANPGNFPVLLYPGEDARDLSRGQLAADDFAGRQLVVFLLDATWRLARSMLRASESLQRLPKVMFSGAEPSRYIIKRQPEAACLSTLEATHELLLALDRCACDSYTDREQLLRHFGDLQDYQLNCEIQNRGPEYVTLKADRTQRFRSRTQSIPAPASKRRRIFPQQRSGD